MNEPKKRHFYWIWWIFLGLVVIFCAVFLLAYHQKSPAKTNLANKSIPDTKPEINIKQHLSSLRGNLSTYLATNKTYAGWQAPTSTQKDVQNAGSAIVTQNMTATTYMIYAKMPNSKVVFCMDNHGASGFTGEVKSVTAKQKTCL